MDNDRTNDEMALEKLFEASSRETPVPDADFMARLADDAARAMPTPAPRAERPRAPFGWLRGLFAASGLTGVALVGVWIGLVMPETLEDILNGQALDDTVSLASFLPGADLTILAGE